MTSSASAGTRMSLVVHLTTGIGSPRNVASRFELVRRHLEVGAEEIRRAGADDERDRQPLLALERPQVHQLQVGVVGEVRAHLAAAAQHQAAAADVARPRHRIDREIEARGDVAAAVVLVLQVERQLVRSTSSPLITTWCTGASADATSTACCGLPSRRMTSPVDRALVGAERGGEPAAAAHHRAGDLEPLRPGVAEQRRLRRPSMIALMSASATGSSWTSTSPIATSRSTKRRRRNLSIVERGHVRSSLGQHRQGLLLKESPAAFHKRRAEAALPRNPPAMCATSAGCALSRLPALRTRIARHIFSGVQACPCA